MFQVHFCYLYRNEKKLRYVRLKFSERISDLTKVKLDNNIDEKQE